MHQHGCTDHSEVEWCICNKFYSQFLLCDVWIHVERQAVFGYSVAEMSREPSGRATARSICVTNDGILPKVISMNHHCRVWEMKSSFDTFSWLWGSWFLGPTMIVLSSPFVSQALISVIFFFFFVADSSFMLLQWGISRLSLNPHSGDVHFSCGRWYAEWMDPLKMASEAHNSLSG